MVTMDLLTRLIAHIEAELGPDIWTEERRASFERAVRIQESGREHYIATPAAMDRAARNKHIRTLYHRDGVTIPQIAERTGLTRQQVWAIVDGRAGKKAA